jgi:hypothetical protein
MVNSSKGSTVNPDQLDEIFGEVVSMELLEQFTPTQLATTVKDIAIMCESVRGDFLEVLFQQVTQKLAEFDVRQLSNVAWGIMRLLPVTDEEVRQEIGMEQQWLDNYVAAVQQQLQQMTQQQTHHHHQQQQQQEPSLPARKLPSAQQLANLLLLPAAAMQPLQPSFVALLEEVLIMRQTSLCGYAVAQLLTCYVR